MTAAIASNVAPASPQERSSLTSLKEEASKARRDAFTRLRTLSNSFSKQRCSHNRKVRFNDRPEVHTLPDVDRKPMFMSYKDKISTADDVEETCYQFNDTDYVHPYVMHLARVWDQCASVEAPKSFNPVKSIEMSPQDLQKLTHGKARGLEKKLATEMKRQRESIVKQVLETQKSYKHMPQGTRAKMIKNKYKKLAVQAKVFALTMAQGDEQVARTLYGNNNIVAATSA